MVSFRSKKLNRTPLVGDLLAETRQKENLSLEKAAASLGIAAKYLRLIETGNFSALPGPIYAKNFLKKYARLLCLDEQAVISRFLDESGKKIPAAGEKSLKRRRQIDLPRLLGHAAVLTVVVVLLTYLSVGLKGIFSPPPLFLENLPEGLVNFESDILLKGRTLPETRVQINGRDVFSGAGGEFEELVTLNPGLNVITVSAVKKHGPTTAVVRNVIYDKK